MLDVCDLVHMLHVERIERKVLAERQGAIANPYWQGDLPSVWEAWEEFDAALVAEPKVIDPAEADLLEALGLR